MNGLCNLSCLGIATQLCGDGKRECDSGTGSAGSCDQSVDHDGVTRGLARELVSDRLMGGECRILEHAGVEKDCWCGADCGDARFAGNLATDAITHPGVCPESGRGGAAGEDDDVKVLILNVLKQRIGFDNDLIAT